MLHGLDQTLSDKCCSVAGQQTFSGSGDQIAELRFDAFFFTCFLFVGFNVDEVNLALVLPGNALPYRLIPFVQIGHQQFVGCTFLLKRAMKEKFNPALVQFPDKFVRRAAFEYADEQRRDKWAR